MLNLNVNRSLKDLIKASVSEPETEIGSTETTLSSTLIFVDRIQDCFEHQLKEQYNLASVFEVCIEKRSIKMLIGNAISTIVKEQELSDPFRSITRKTKDVTIHRVRMKIILLCLLNEGLLIQALDFLIQFASSHDIYEREAFSISDEADPLVQIISQLSGVKFSISDETIKSIIS